MCRARAAIAAWSMNGVSAQTLTQTHTDPRPVTSLPVPARPGPTSSQFNGALLTPVRRTDTSLGQFIDPLGRPLCPLPPPVTYRKTSCRCSRIKHSLQAHRPHHRITHGDESDIGDKVFPRSRSLYDDSLCLRCLCLGSSSALRQNPLPVILYKLTDGLACRQQMLHTARSGFLYWIFCSTPPITLQEVDPRM